MPTIAEALESALEQHETTEAEAAPEVTPEVTTEETKEPRARSEDGKFAKKEPEATPEPTPEPAPRKAPSSWKPAAQEAFLKADRGETLTTDEIKILTQEAERRESDFHKGVSEFKGHSERAKAYDAAIAPYQQHLQSLGVDAPTAINALMRADMTLRTSDPVTKAQYFSQLAKEYNIDLNQLHEPPQVDPQTQYLMNELQVLRNQQQMWQNQARQQEQAIAQDQLASFATPDRQHFDAVRNEMAFLLETGKAKDLQEAYEKAVWSDPDIRQSLLDQQRAEAQKKALEQAQAQKARTAAVSVKGSSPASSGVQPGNKGSLRDILAAQFDS
jgi:hypothetical protein